MTVVGLKGFRINSGKAKMVVGVLTNGGFKGRYHISIGRFQTVPLKPA